MSETENEGDERDDGAPGDRRGLALLLFIATCLSTLYVGSAQATGSDPLSAWSGVNGASDLLPSIWRVSHALVRGWVFAVPLMAILVVHEFAHWIAMRRHGIPSTLPLFIPFPNVFGTMGAVIAMRDGVRSRNALVDVGASGPLAGLVVAMGVTIGGLARSPVEPIAGRTNVFVEGDSLVYLALKRLVCGPIPPGHDVWLHPVAFAGWVGLFMTMMNLLPIGQLDGGHVAYALFGPSYDRWSMRVIAAVAGWAASLAVYLAATNPRSAWSSELFTPASVWALWAFVTWLVLRSSGGRHPPTEENSLTPARRVIAVFTLALFAALFMPLPVRLH